MRRTATYACSKSETSLGHIASIAYSYSGNSLGNLVYAYDQAGRRTAVTGSLAQTNLPTLYGQGTYDAANELTAWNGTAFSYDADGNMTTGLYGQQYTWDARNQLSSLSGSSAASFSYDAFGRRVGETISGTTTSFQYDGVNRIAETSGSSTATILTGGVDEFFQRTDSNGTTWPLADALGSTIAMTDSSGTLATTYTYDPYGGTMSGGAGSYNTSQYTGRENDGTGLYYYRARYYNPAIGRFISPDPIGFAGGINFYAYVLDNPVSFIDPFGLKPRNPPPPPPPWKQKNQDCLNQINNTPDGKFYNFFSPLSMIPGIGPEWQSSMAEDLGGGTAKYLAFKFFQGAGANWTRHRTWGDRTNGFWRY